MGLIYFVVVCCRELLVFGFAASLGYCKSAVLTLLDGTVKLWQLLECYILCDVVT